MNASVENTHRKYGNHRFVIIPNRFDNCELSEAIEALGEARHAELKTKAEASNWSEKRLEAEIRCLADEVAPYSDSE